jgi:dihydroorotate dehydrogenase
MYKALIRPIFFLFNPESIHHFTFKMVKLLMHLPGMFGFTKNMYQVKDKRLNRTVMGIDFPNPVGLAAGFDKDAKLFDELSAYDFGFIEIGTVTPKAQPGNPLPRLFRVPKDKGLINRMGFNNGGLEKAVYRLSKKKTDVIIGGNIGKNKVTPNEEATEDYVKGFQALFNYVDYFVVNVSSPNTPGLRELQEKAPLMELLKTLQLLNNAKEIPKPIALKIAPDLTDSQLDDIIEIAKEVKLSAIIATNTTIDRSGLNTSSTAINEIGAGGLSGAPVRKRSTEVVKYLKAGLPVETAIIAVGGIFTGADALEKLNAGADLIQVYTGFVYEGPSIVKNINKAILSSLN